MQHTLHVSDRLVSASHGQRTFDLEGVIILPGIVYLHGDGFERDLAPCCSASTELQQGFEAAHNELAANALINVVLAQFYSW